MAHELALRRINWFSIYFVTKNPPAIRCISKAKLKLHYLLFIVKNIHQHRMTALYLRKDACAYKISEPFSAVLYAEDRYPLTSFTKNSSNGS